MKTKFFQEIKQAVENNELQKVNEILPDEFNVCSNRLDHIDISEDKIVFHDSGINFGEGIIDCTFSVLRL